MIRDKRIAIGLGSGVVALVALTVAQQVGLGSGFRLREGDTETERDATLTAIDREPFRLGPWVDYGEVLARPLFNDTRAPEPVDATADAGPADGTASPLNVLLTGVILSGELKLALVRDNANGETQRVRVGQPLEGEQAGWTLIELKPRLAVFEGAGLGRQELELTVDTKGGTAAVVQPGAQATAQTPVFQSTAGQQPPNTPGYVAPGAAPVPAPGQPANAEEIRKRIEERRRQLREEAQKMMQQNENKQ